MNLEIKNILDRIEDNGFEAYIVGGYVRDYLLGIDSVDIDICTNALPKDVISIFDIKKEVSSYGSITIHSGKYNFDITTYRKESNYVNRRPQTVEYINNLLLDINRRDFTMNSLCMNSNGQIFDYLNGREDINNHLVKIIGDTKTKLTEDPLRILRAIRFAIVLDFELDKEILDFIYNNKTLVDSLSFTRKKEELDKIFSSKNVIKGLNLLKHLELLSSLEIEYDKIVYVPDLLGIWAQISFSDKYSFTRNNLNIIKKIRLILKEGKITNYTLYRDGLYIAGVAGEILGYDKKEINQMYHDLELHSKNDLVVNSKDIMDILKIEPSSKVKIIYNDIINNILNNNLVNDYDAIKNYILNNWK